MYLNLVGSVQVTIFTDLSLQIVMATIAITQLAEIEYFKAAAFHNWMCYIQTR